MTLFSNFFSMKFKMKDFPLFNDPEQFNSHDVFEIRPMNIAVELPIIQRWVSWSSSDSFWQMSGISLKDLDRVDDSNVDASHFVILVNNVVIAYFEVYIPFKGELGGLHSFSPDDIGFQFILGPCKEMNEALPNQIFNLTRNLLILIVHYIFKYSNAMTVYVVPGMDNIAAVIVGEFVGFKFECVLNLSNRCASLYAFDKWPFYRSYKCLS